MEKCATVQQWLDDLVARQSERPKNVDPVLKSSEVLKKREEIIYFATPILTKPKPKPPKVDTPPASETPKSGQQTPGDQPPPAEAPKDNGPSEMDVD